MKTILHIDFDSFFASVEQQDHPELRGKPVGVTAAHSRTAIIAASKEAKKMGVKGGSSYWQAKKVCPQIVTTPAHFVKYFEISKKFIQICRLYSPYLEVFSIDELFLDISATAHLFGGTDSLIARLKEHIKREMGEIITVSVGVSYNKMLAKMASGMDKPNGVTKITPDNVDDVYKKASLTDVCGIGFRIEKRLHMLGIRNLLDLRSIPIGALVAEFGPHEATFLHNVAFAKDETPVVHFGSAIQTKSVGRNYCLPKNETNKRVILQTVFELLEEVGIKLRKLGKKSRSIGVWLRGDESFGGHKTTDFYVNSGKDMFDILQKAGLLRSVTQASYIRQVSVWAGFLQDENFLTRSLFATEKEEKLQKVVDNINTVFGDHTIRNGFLLYSDKLTTVPNGFLADRWERKELGKLY
ncbi:MAG TPA: DNA polymerase IV [Patescibacteria group bacterium]|nr:DNA polymerase IV [Patescibacteria group bacterium]